MSTDFARVKQAFAPRVAEFYGAALGVQLRPSGKGFAPVVCPFHLDGNHPNLTIFVDGGFACFACGEKGDVFDFVVKRENVKKGEALRRVAEFAGVRLDPPPGRKQDRVSIEAIDRAHAALLGNPNALDFLARARAIPRAVVERFRLGLFSSGVAEDSTLDGHRIFDFVYPIRVDPATWFPSARRYRPHLPKAGDAPRRYWAPAFGAITPRPTAPLFGIVEAEILRTERPPSDDPGFDLILTEGEDKALALHGLDLPAAALTLGIGSWPPRWRKHFRGLRVVFVPDMDDAGLAGIESCKRYMAGAGAASLRIVRLPLAGTKEEKDVTDWLVAKGGTREAFIDMVKEAPLEDLTAPVEASEPAHASADRSGLTDWGNAERLVKLRGDDLRYCGPWRRFLLWDGTRWVIDETGEALRLARATVRDIHAEAKRAFAVAADERGPDARKRLVADAEKIKRHAVASEHKDRLGAMVALAQSEPGIPLLPTALDSDRWALNVANGTLDLKTGALRSHRREDLLTKLAPVAFDPAATAPTWAAFLDRIFAGNVELIGFLQRATGYALTSDTSERCLFIMHGDGANGKSTMLRVILALLGDYAQQAPVDLLMQKNKNDGDAPSPSLAKLRGARVAAVVEAEEGRRLAESLVKHLTGQDRVTARPMYGDPFEFDPEFKLFLATNHKPRIRGTDPAIWDRIRLVPFNVSIPMKDRDGKLFDKLKAELPGILAWAVAGCLAWQRDGLRPPVEVEAATATYRADSDILGGFLRDRCVMTPAASASAKDLYAAYRAWCEDQDERPAGRQDFGAELAKRGCDSGRRKGRAHWYRIGLLAEQGEEGEKGEEVSGTSPIETDSSLRQQWQKTGLPPHPSHPEDPAEPEPEEVL